MISENDMLFVEIKDRTYLHNKVFVFCYSPLHKESDESKMFGITKTWP